MHRRPFRLVALVLVAIAIPSLTWAQDDDSALRPAEPDFTLVSLPTSLRLPTFGSAFRITHRFQRTLGEGDFGDLAGDLFGLDRGATIGIEYRFGLAKNLQVGFHRSSRAKTFEFFGQYGLLRQTTAGVDISLRAGVEGLDNFKTSRSPAVSAIVSRTVGEWAAFYIEPLWANNANPLPKEVVDDNDTLAVGIGARIRVRPTVYVVAEAAPRGRGFAPDVMHGSFGIEKRAGGHLFQLNFSNGFGTTPAQIARGGTGSSDWYLGFNISRKFF